MEFISCVSETKTTVRNQSLKQETENKSDQEGKKKEVQMKERHDPRKE